MRVHWALRLYPPAWRDRYAAEVAAVLDQQRVTLLTLFDLLRGALDAQTDPAYGEPGMRADVMHLLRTNGPILRPGLTCGVLLGSAWIAYDLVNNLANPDATLNSVLNNGITVAVISLSGLAGFLAVWRTRKLRTGVLAGLTAGVISAGIGLTTLWLVTLLFLDTIRHNSGMLYDFQRSGMRSLDAFIIDDALGATFFGGLLALGACLVGGTLGGLLGKTARRLG